MKKPRILLGIIIILTLLAIFIDVPSLNNFSLGPIKGINFRQSTYLQKIGINKELAFRRGLDLEGGTSIVFRANMQNLSAGQRSNALESAKTVIERRINYFGVAESLIQTSSVNGDSRIIVELPGVDIDQAKAMIGTTAQLSFWEQGASGSGKLKNASASALPIGMLQYVGPDARKTDLNGKDLSQTSVSFDKNTGKPQVQLVFTSDGAKKFADITKRNVGKVVAIVLDQGVIEAPRVNEPILTGDAVITGSFTLEQAKMLSTQLNAGALPVPLSVLSQRGVEATLGVSSLDKSLFAGLIGFVIIVVFMVVLYGSLGVIASLALIVYTLLVLAIFKASTLTPYSITLTLSGIAGFILSIGMAVDANILIFERMKEEERQGRSRKVAIEIGFSRAWTSIRDSNVSTLLTSAVLYKFGTGIVRGFALVLAIGVLVSMFSAIVVTRTFLRYIYK